MVENFLRISRRIKGQSESILYTIGFLLKNLSLVYLGIKNNQLALISIKLTYFFYTQKEK